VLLINTTFCFYCFNPADSRDHIIPIARERLDDINAEVPCCRHCNSLAGHHYFPTLEEKAKWLMYQAMKRKRLDFSTMLANVRLVAETILRHDHGRSSVHNAVAITTSECAICGRTHCLRLKCRQLLYQDNRRRLKRNLRAPAPPAFRYHWEHTTNAQQIARNAGPITNFTTPKPVDVCRTARPHLSVPSYSPSFSTSQPPCRHCNLPFRSKSNRKWYCSRSACRDDRRYSTV
jgi:hypothetical protein